MKNNCVSFFRRMFSDQRGQSAVWVAVSLTALMGMAGLTLDLGHAYVVRSQLQASVNAAALSGASAAGLYNTGANSAANIAQTYAAQYPVQGAGTAAVSTPCINLLMENNTGCTNDSSGNATGSVPANAVRVHNTANVPMFFMKVFGVSSIQVGATAIAAMASTQPWNVAIILDATGSMNSNDPYCSTSNTTAEQCAMNGIQTMLKGINPCYGSTSCEANNANAIFRVSFFTFPNVTTATVADDYNCGGTPASAQYTLPVIPTASTTDGYEPFSYSNTTTTYNNRTKQYQTTTTTWTATYQVTQPNVGNADANGFLSDYYSGGSLNPNSILVKIIGNGSTAGCMAVPSNSFVTGSGSSAGGETYFAGAIYAAQTALLAEQNAVTALGIKSKNAIIFVSDGQAGAYPGAFPPVVSTASNTSDGYSVTSNGSSTTNMTGAANSFGIYPDYNDQCQQAIAAAQAARNLGTRFYAVAYGSESNGCGSNASSGSGWSYNPGGTDSTTVVTGTLNVPITNAQNLNPCTTMEDMASPVNSVSGLWYFYTDGSSNAKGCSDAGHTTLNLQSIFGAISATFKNARLVPSNAT